MFEFKHGVFQLNEIAFEGFLVVLRVALIVTIRNVWDYHLVIEEINELKSLQVD